MKLNDPRKVLSWLQSRPSQQALREAFPEEWDVVEKELADAITRRDPASLHRLLNPPPLSQVPKATLGKQDKTRRLQLAIRQRMAALAIERYSLAVATGRSSGKVRFNLFNGLLVQRLLFRRGFERKPASLFWFRLLWPLVWQKRFLMPLAERKGIYCFYSRALIDQLQQLIGDRSCLEIAAGDGTLSRFLRERGVRITATDDYSWQDRIAFPESVVRLPAQMALRQYTPKVVLCSWPPARNPFEGEVFRTPGVELYIAIVSQHKFASGNWAEYESQRHFDLEPRPDLSRLLLPPELGAEVVLFRRRALAGQAD